MQHTHRASFIHGELFWLFHIVVSYVLAHKKKKKSFICFGYLLLVWNIFCHIISNALNERVAKSEVFSNSFIL